MRTSLLLTVGLLVGAAACQGDISSKPPVHLEQNMFQQKRFEMQDENPYFADDRDMRMPVQGTVALDELKLDEHLYRGRQVKVPKKKAGATATTAGQPAEVEYEPVRTLPPFDEKGKPLLADAAFLQRGQERYRIFCSVCHGLSGDGDGIAVIRGFVQPPTYWENRLIGAPIGHFFEVISNGQGNMPSYAAQIPVRDRWAIASYVRVLERRRDASLDQVPVAEAQAKGWSKP